MGYKKNTFNTIVTKKDIIEKLQELGVKQGMILEVHASLSSFGYVVGGAQTIVDALMEVVGYEGTILMPIHCHENSEPLFWNTRNLPCDQITHIRDNIPSFDKRSFDSFNMGVIAENMRRRQGVSYSNHPMFSHVAWGQYAKFLCHSHTLHFPLSVQSPIAKLTELKGSILLLGCDFDKATIFHLGEDICRCRPICIEGAATEVRGERTWKKYLSAEYSKEELISIGQCLNQEGKVIQNTIGDADCKLFKAIDALNSTISYLNENTCLKYYKY